MFVHKVEAKCEMILRSLNEGPDYPNFDDGLQFAP